MSLAQFSAGVFCPTDKLLNFLQRYFCPMNKLLRYFCPANKSPSISGYKLVYLYMYLAYFFALLEFSPSYSQ